MDTANWTVDEFIEHQHHQAKVISTMLEMSLNVKFTSWLHYDLPWLDAHVSDHYDAAAVLDRLNAIGPSPVILRHMNDGDPCDDCGAYEHKHELGCPTWGFNS